MGRCRGRLEWYRTTLVMSASLQTLNGKREVLFAMYSNCPIYMYIVHRNLLLGSNFKGQGQWKIQCLKDEVKCVDSCNWQIIVIRLDPFQTDKWTQSQWGSETKSRQMFHNSWHFYDVTFSQICSGNITSLCFYQLDAEEILMYHNQG